MSLEAEGSMREINALTARTRDASRSMATGLPLVGWGAAWVVGLGALDLLDGITRIAVVTVAWLFGMLLSWLPLRTAIRTGAEFRIRWAWAVVLLASPFLVMAAQPESFSHSVLLVGALWGLAMCLYAVAGSDWLFLIVAAFGILMAGVMALAETPTRLLWYGLAAGIPLLALGIHRTPKGMRRG